MIPNIYLTIGGKLAIMWKTKANPRGVDFVKCWMIHSNKIRSITILENGGQKIVIVGQKDNIHGLSTSVHPFHWVNIRWQVSQTNYIEQLQGVVPLILTISHDPVSGIHFFSLWWYKCFWHWRRMTRGSRASVCWHVTIMANIVCVVWYISTVVIWIHVGEVGGSSGACSHTFDSLVVLFPFQIHLTSISESGKLHGW